jgi:Fe-S-cluster-containing dehydrogenase component
MNGVPIGNFWNKTLRIGPNPKYEGAQFPDVEMYFLTVQCQHCEDPECVKVCPTQASHKLDDGTVQIDKSKCIGCQFCVMSCPYGVRYLNEDERVVEKCTLCEQRVAQDELAACVAQCGGFARWFGDLDEGIETFRGPYGKQLGELVGDGCDYPVKPFSDSDVHTLPNVGNNPSFRYILRDRTWQGEE